ncbi:hypothetical protein [Clostridium saccharobutylicum]|nr:hypothetical protein [Clostridium saccharobutylicum]AQR92158.1 hypothetical protein CLOSC_38880 [Clostridium saccharobutylicum]AQS02060.1 hypothetical protein CSACC_38930 [Clostridium saccharobutylicum]AQS11664.1 hypothetical protein CLOBY_38220 [Clostridium saccharobutylicum]AQS16043.1 hypothetical protein CLOSACC_38930 [Clostridium saccharobutylicum]MBA2903660.1 hypothetical protein [Clostridium saccharobutylicum]
MPIVLIIIGVVLIIYNYRAIKREENTSNFSFENILNNNKEDVNDYKIELGIIRRDIAESLTELQQEIIEIKNELNILKNVEEVYENKAEIENNKNEYTESNDDNNVEESNIEINLDIDKEVISEINFSEIKKNIDSSKTESIKKLLLDGLTEEQICRELSISKGEVLLVKGLFKK